MAEQEKEPYYFNISLSILNHLGRDLYRNFITVLGEAISNSWDAGAKNVWIKIDKKNGCFSIKDDGHGMSEADFRKKFLNVGYSRREDNNARAPEGRPLIGGKGIGKLALLSCAQRIHIMSKTSDTEYIGAIIDNGELDIAIDSENKAESKNYELAELKEEKFKDLKNEDEGAHGTILYFENMNDGIINTIETLRRLIAMHFRFSLACKSDDSFSISVNKTPVGFDDLKDFSDKTQFLWTINEFDDPFLETLKTPKEKFEQENITVCKEHIKGFIASVEKPSNLKVFGTKEKIGIDVFVNGRLRERNILRHMPDFATRVVASYLYGQIHLDILDDGDPKMSARFTTSREGIKPEDRLYKIFLQKIEKKMLEKISKRWDEWRIKHNQDGDPEEKTLSIYTRRLKESNDYRKKDFENKINKLENIDNNMKIILNKALLELSFDNTKIYQDLFILENLFRVFLEQSNVCDIDKLDTIFPNDLEIEGKGGYMKKLTRIKNSRKNQEEHHELEGKIVKRDYDLNYFDLMQLGNLTDKLSGHTSANSKDDIQRIRPVRNAVMHTNEISKAVMLWDDIKDLIGVIDKLAP